VDQELKNQYPLTSVRWSIANDAMQMDVNKTLYPFYTIKKMPHVTVTITKNTLRWQQ